jgi:hypothetical protein
MIPQRKLKQTLEITTRVATGLPWCTSRSSFTGTSNPKLAPPELFGDESWIGHVMFGPASANVGLKLKTKTQNQNV